MLPAAIDVNDLVPVQQLSQVPEGDVCGFLDQQGGESVAIGWNQRNNHYNGFE